MTRSPRPRKTATLSESVYRKLNMYALAASATGTGLLSLVQPARAEIIYTPANVKIGTSTFLDLNNDGINDFKFINTVHTSFRRQECSQGTTGNLAVYGLRPANKIFGQSVWASALPAASYIGPGGKFLGKGMAKAFAACGEPENRDGFWAGGSGRGIEHRYLGLKFRINGEIHFAWARLDTAISGGTIQATLTGYAYETIPNKRIIAGHTKGSDATTLQPASLGHLAAGASAIPAWRRGEVVAPGH
jgi:hypothetical protein